MTWGTRDSSDLVVGNYTFHQMKYFKYLKANINQFWQVILMFTIQCKEVLEPPQRRFNSNHLILI